MPLSDFFTATPVLTLAEAALVLFAGFFLGHAVMRAILHLADKSGIRQKVRFGIEREAKKFGFEFDSINFFAALAKYSVYLIALLIAMELAGLKAATTFLGLFLPFVPQVFASIMILLFGSIAIEIVSDVAKFGLRDHLDGMARDLGLSQSLSTTLSALLRYFLYLLLLLTALLQLGFRAGPFLDFLIYLVLIAVSAVAIVAILSVNNYAPNMSAWLYLKNSGSLKEGDKISIGKVSGKVEKINAINTVIADGANRHVVPNSKLVNEGFTVKKE